MPFQIVTGTMGGGKSYMAAEKAIQCWQEGGIVHSNMDWIDAELEARGYADKHVRLPDDPREWINVIQGGAEGQENMLICDESSLIFHVWDQTNNKDRDRDLYTALAMSRKLGLDTYFISQDADNVSAALRRLAGFEIYCVATKNVPFWGPFYSVFYGDFLRKTLRPKNRRELGRTYHRYDEKVGTIYKTEALRGVATQISRNPTRKKQKVKIPRLHLALFILAALAVPLGFAHSWRNLSKASDERQQRTETGSSPQPATPAPRPLNFGNLAAAALTPQARPAPQAGPPPLHPFGEPSGRTSRWVEWSADDERIIVSRYSGPDGVRVYTLGGDVFQVGRHIEGETISGMHSHAGEWWATTDTGRTFYLRRRTYRERRAYDVYLAEQAATKPAAPLAIPASPQ